VDTIPYTIKTEFFEGPLDVLLGLIEKRKLLINDVSLAQVADGYIAHVQQLSDFPLADSTQFILIAATLLLIKSKSLLPELSFSEEEQQSVDDLEKRLSIHHQYKEKAQGIKALFGKHILFSAQVKKEDKTMFVPDTRVTQTYMRDIVEHVLRSMPDLVTLPHTVIQQVVSLEEMVVSLTHRITQNLKMNFREMSGQGKKEKVSVIVTFLALLELVKQGVINVTQDAVFEDIEMEPRVVSVPRYE
jgi:segregation and condensation protein A